MIKKTYVFTHLYSSIEIRRKIIIVKKQKKNVYQKIFTKIKSERKSLNFKNYPLGNKLVGLDQNNLNSLVKSLKCFNVH